MPTQLKKIGDLIELNIVKAKSKHQPQHIQTFKINKYGEMIKSRVPLLFNDDLIISIANLNEDMNYFYRNGHYDEMLYIQHGSGKIMSNILES